MRTVVGDGAPIVARWIPLGPGYVVMTGAPGTAVPVGPGDLVRVEVNRIGASENGVM